MRDKNLRVACFAMFAVAFVAASTAVAEAPVAPLETAYATARGFLSATKALSAAQAAPSVPPSVVAQVTDAKVDPLAELRERLPKLIATALNKNPALGKQIGVSSSIGPYLAGRLGFSCGAGDACLRVHDIRGGGGHYITSLP